MPGNLKGSIPKKLIGELQTGFHFTDIGLRKKGSVPDPDPTNPHVLGPPDPDPYPLVRCMDLDPGPAP